MRARPPSSFDRRAGLLSCREFGFEGMIFLESAYSEHTETDDTALLVHAPHHRVASRRPHVTGRVRKGHLELIMFRVKPQFYFIDHNLSPAFHVFVNAPLLRWPLPLQFMMKEPVNTPIPAITFHCAAWRSGSASTIATTVSPAFDARPLARSSSSAWSIAVSLEAITPPNVSAVPSLNPVMVVANTR
jgi:hypothetical protein